MVANAEYTPEEKEMVAHLLQQGKSAKMIGIAIGRSKNSVISIVHRDKALREIGFTGSPARKYTKKRYKVDAKARFARALQRVNTMSEDAPPLMLDCETITMKGCRFVYGDPKNGEWGFCGHEKTVGSYCDLHAEKVYTPVKFSMERKTWLKRYVS